MISDLHDKEDRPIHYSNPRALRAIKDVTTGLNPSEVFVARLCQRAFLKLNAELSKAWPTITEKKDAPDDADDWKDTKDKVGLLER